MIDQILTFLFRRRKPSLRKYGENALLNYALELAQEWGENWLLPIQERLGKAYPQLSPQELEHYNAVVQAAMKCGHDLVYSMAEEYGKDVSEPNWRETYLAQYPWVDKKNLSHLFSTGMYYAWKDGVGR
jgi:hypothetical protein